MRRTYPTDCDKTINARTELIRPRHLGTLTRSKHSLLHFLLLWCTKKGGGSDKACFASEQNDWRFNVIVVTYWGLLFARSKSIGATLHFYLQDISLHTPKGRCLYRDLSGLALSTFASFEQVRKTFKAYILPYVAQWHIGMLDFVWTAYNGESTCSGSLHAIGF